MKILQIHKFVGEHGEHVDGFTEHGAVLPVFVKFIGHGSVRLEVDGKKGLAPASFLLPGAQSVEEAFEMYIPCLLRCETEKQAALNAQILREKLAGGRN